LATEGVGAVAEGPVEVEGQLEGAAAVAPLVGEVAGGLAHEAAGQGGRPGRGEEHLRLPGVGAARRRHLAAAPRLLSNPLDGVVAVPVLAPAVIDKGIPRPLRAEAPADILDDEDKAALREVLRRLRAQDDGLLAVVRGAFDDGGEAAV